MEIVTRQAARAVGKPTYFTGKPCKHGHIALRYTTWGLCFKCNGSYARANPDKVREYNRRSMERKLSTPEGRARQIKLTRDWQRRMRSTQEGWARQQLWSIRRGAKRRGLIFDLVWQDILPPATCPVFGTSFSFLPPRNPRTASVDRIDNRLGYVRGNVRVISWRANDLKKNASLDELRAVVRYMEACHTG